MTKHRTFYPIMFGQGVLDILMGAIIVPIEYPITALVGFGVGLVGLWFILMSIELAKVRV